MQILPRLITAGLLTLAAIVAPAATPDGRASPSAPAATPPAASATGTGQTAVAADFSKGFALLHHLGVTNVSQASYVTLSGPEVMMYASRGARYGMTGNAWQLSGDATNGLFLVNETMLVRATTAKQSFSNGMDRLAQMRATSDGVEEDDETVGILSPRTLHDAKWKRADLQADLDRLLPKLQKEADKYLAAKAKESQEHEGEDDSMRRMREMQSIAGGDLGQWVACLLRAVHVADQGHLPEANRMAMLSMTLSGGNQKLLEAVMDRLGNEAYQKVWAQFRAQGDWKAYADGVDAVTARFPRGWQAAAGARELAPRLHAFAAAGAHPAVRKAQLAAGDEALVDALATAPACREADAAVQQPGFWVLPRDTNDFIGAWVATNAHPLARLLRGGTNAIPVLVTLLDDSATFTHVQTYGMPAGTNAAAAAGDTEDDAARMMQEMEMARMRGAGAGNIVRPATRGEIATQLLEALVNGDQQDFSPARGRRGGRQVKPLAERVRTWQEERAGMSTELLAFACLTGKDYGQRSQAVQYLAASSSTAAWQRLEKYMLSGSGRDENLWLVQLYVQRRGKDAKPFVDALEAQIKSGAAPTNAVRTSTADGEEELFKGNGASDPMAKYRVQQQQRMLKELRRIVDAKPFDVVVDEIATGKLSLEAGRESLARSYYDVPYAERMSAAVRAAAKAQAPDVRIGLLWLTRRPDERAMAQYEAMMAQRGGAPVAKPEPPAVAPLADAWRTLLADARPSTNRTTNFWHPPVTVRETAALSMELIYGHPSATELGGTALMDELGSAGIQLALQRAESRLAGAAPVQPPLPDPASVSAGRLADLTNALPRAALSARAAQVAGLNVNERLMVARAARANPALAAALAPVACRMRAAAADGTPAAARAALEACDGKILDVAALQGLVRQCDELARQGQPVTFELLRRAGCGGVDVAARMAQPNDAIGVDSVAGVGFGVETLDAAPETMVLHPGVPAAAPDAAAAADDPLKRPSDAELIASEIARIQRGPMTAAEAEAVFWKRIDALCTTDPAVGFPAGIRITPVIPAKAAAK